MLLSILSYILVELNDGNEPDFQTIWQHTNKPLTLCSLFQHQSEIGWTSILQGFITTEWGTLQRQYMNMNPRLIDPSKQVWKQTNSDTISTWKQHMVNELVQYALDSWNYRNDQLHGKKLAKENCTDHQRQLIQQIHRLYCESAILT